MATVVICRPFSQSLADLSASSQFEVHQYPFPKLQQKPRVQSHYRPFSTLVALDEKPAAASASSHRNSVLVKTRRQSTTIQRSASVGGNMGLGTKKISEKTKTKEKAKELPRLRIRKLSDPPLPSPHAVASPSSSSTKSMSRPATSCGESLSERWSSGGKAAPQRVKAQRSITSLFSATSDVSLSPGLSESVPRSKIAAPPSSFRPIKLDVDRLPPTPTSARSKRFSRLDPVCDDKMKHAYLGRNDWRERGKVRLHPYPDEAPYPRSYEIPCLDSDRYTDLLLQRLNPGSPSFHEFGKKSPLTVLDLGCGQGHWALWAASVWKTSRITGFDLVDITLPAFQTTENVNFVRGNFLTKLPFPAKSFEYVRMSNLGLCIPLSQWESLLMEIKRILTHGGRLELVDDQIFFPYGDEPKLKEFRKPESPSVKTSDTSFSKFDNDSDSGDDDTFENGSTSTASTLVSEYDTHSYKLPSSKRSSAQSNPSVAIIDIVPPIPLPNRDKPLPIPTETPQPSPLKETTTSTISPSPTITQDNINSLDYSVSLATSTTTITQDSPVKERTKHRKTDSGSSTKSNSEVISAWLQKRDLSRSMEAIFECILLKNSIHPRPSDFVQDHLRQVFGKGNAGKVRSYHIKLAPFDSPIGPGGTMAPRLPTIEPPLRLDRDIRPAPSSSDQLKKHWRQMSDGKKEKKEKKQVKKMRERVDSTASRTSFDDTPQPAIITPKAASRLGIVPTVNQPSKRTSAESSEHSDDDNECESQTSSQRSSVIQRSKPSPPVVDKAADRLGIPSNPPPVPPKPISTSRSSEARTPRPPPPIRGPTAPELSPAAANRLGIPIRQAMSRSHSTGSSEFGISASKSSTVNDLLNAGLPPPIPMSRKFSIDSNPSSAGELSSSDNSVPDIPAPTLSAKAAGRLGVSYSVLAAAAAERNRSSGAMAPAQSPGLLVWPSTYISMSPTELEQHSCKYVQTVLGCRSALKEHILGVEEFGQKVATEDDFEEGIWEYECFRRSRFHWPNDNPELFVTQGFPEPPSPRDLVRPLGKPGRSRNNSLDSFNGQYRHEDLTHLRTIRVFEAVKTVDEKTFVSMLFPSVQPVEREGQRMKST